MDHGSRGKGRGLGKYNTARKKYGGYNTPPPLSQFFPFGGPQKFTLVGQRASACRIVPKREGSQQWYVKILHTLVHMGLVLLACLKFLFPWNTSVQVSPPYSIYHLQLKQSVSGLICGCGIMCGLNLLVLYSAL